MDTTAERVGDITAEVLARAQAQLRESSGPTPTFSGQTASGQGSRSTTSSGTILEARHMARLWTVMARLYGSSWSQQFGEADDGTWLRALDGVTPHQVAIGLDRLKDREENRFPPNAFEFRALCLRDEPKRWGTDSQRPTPPAIGYGGDETPNVEIPHDATNAEVKAAFSVWSKLFRAGHAFPKGSNPLVETIWMGRLGELPRGVE